METNEIILGLTALVLVVFSLVVSLVVPRRNPGFPGRRMGVFVAVVAVLVVGQLTAVFVLEEEHTEEAEAPEPAPPAAEPAPPAAEPAPPAVEGDPAAGKEVFASAGCVACHTLAEAGSTGNVGPNLDDARPPYELVIERVTNGMGAMPPFQDSLSAAQIQDVAAYVVQATSG